MNKTFPDAAVASSRDHSLDLLRGVAVFGILLINIKCMGASAFTSSPDAAAAFSALDLAIVSISDSFVEGSMRGLFCIAFGAAAAIFMGPMHRGKTRDRAFLMRGAVLCLLGAVDILLLAWPGDVLFLYGALTPIVLGLTKLSARHLVIAATLLLALSIGREAVSAGGMTEASLATFRAAEIVAHSDSFVTLATWNAELWVRFNLLPFLTGGFLSDLSLMTVGAAMVRGGVIGVRHARGHTYAAAALLYCCAAAARVAQFSAYGALYGALDEAARLTLTAAHTALLIAWSRAPHAGVMRGFLTHVGRYSLSNYLLASALALLVFEGAGLWGRLGPVSLWGVAGLIWATQAAFVIVMTKTGHQGPMETILRLWAPTDFAPRRPRMRPVAHTRRLRRAKLRIAAGDPMQARGRDLHIWRYERAKHAFR